MENLTIEEKKLINDLIDTLNNIMNDFEPFVVMNENRFEEGKVKKLYDLLTQIENCRNTLAKEFNLSTIKSPERVYMYGDFSAEQLKDMADKKGFKELSKRITKELSEKGTVDFRLEDIEKLKVLVKKRNEENEEF